MYVINLTAHASHRMRRRGITVKDIEQALSSCIQHLPGDQGGVCHVGHGVNGNELKVWTPPMPLDHSGGRVTVKSVAWKGTS